MGLAELGGRSRTALERLFCNGTEPRIDDLLGWEFLGVVPGPIGKVYEKFVKVFVATDDGPGGYNVVCSQKDWRRRRFRGGDLRHGYFDLRRATGHRTGCLLLDYGSPERNPTLYPARLFRDFVVHPDPHDRDLLLGKAFVKLGRLVPVGFFVCGRDRPVA